MESGHSDAFAGMLDDVLAAGMFDDVLAEGTLKTSSSDADSDDIAFSLLELVPSSSWICLAAIRFRCFSPN